MKIPTPSRAKTASEEWDYFYCRIWREAGFARGKLFRLREQRQEAAQRHDWVTEAAAQAADAKLHEEWQRANYRTAR